MGNQIATGIVYALQAAPEDDRPAAIKMTRRDELVRAVAGPFTNARGICPVARILLVAVIPGE